MSFQDLLGQLPLLKSYTHILLVFPLSNSQRHHVLEALQCATRRLLATFPFLSGAVVHQVPHPGHSGTFSVVLPEGDSSDRVHQILHVKDLSSILPDYAALESAKVPPTMLPGSLVAPPRPAFPRVYTESSAPVLEIQASLINDGLLLTLAAQHNVVDATGIFYIAHLLSRFMHDPTASIPDAEVAMGNIDRRNLIPLLPEHQALPEEMGIFTTDRPPPLTREILDEYQWTLVHFSPAALRDIHDEAMSRPSDFVEGVSSVSVNDALTAFCWQRLSAVRAKHSQTGGEAQGEGAMTQLTRAADLRRAMGLNAGYAYMGHMVRTSNLRLPLSTLICPGTSLSHISSLLRKCLREHTEPQAISAYATLLSRTEDKSRILYAAGFNPLTDLSVSSVAHVEVPNFGMVLGKPTFVRRPTFGPLPGGMYIGPSIGAEREGGSGEGGLDAVVCLRGWEMEGLARDSEWKEKVVVWGNCGSYTALIRPISTYETVLYNWSA
ncbi:hypothetical protein BDV11DRAFT_209722 [Aspergillus similis]